MSIVDMDFAIISRLSLKISRCVFLRYFIGRKYFIHKKYDMRTSKGSASINA